jgi:hypothetical protein
VHERWPEIRTWRGTYFQALILEHPLQISSGKAVDGYPISGHEVGPVDRFYRHGIQCVEHFHGLSGILRHAALSALPAVISSLSLIFRLSSAGSVAAIHSPSSGG